MITFLLAALPAVLPVQEVERGVPWYWPRGSLYGSHAILQGYGQLQTIDGVPDLHEGLDIDATPDEEVWAPISGTVVGVDDDGDIYDTVYLAADGDWSLEVVHLSEIKVGEGDPVVRGQLLGYVREWTAPDEEFTQVHLGLFACAGCDVLSDAKEFLGDPLTYLGGRSDSWAPSFLSIEAGGDSYSPVAFVSDTVLPGTGSLTFQDPSDLPAEKLDVLVRVSDRFSPWMFLLMPVFSSGMFVVSVPEPVIPSRLSLRITSDSTGEEVYERVLDLTGEIGYVPYLEDDFGDYGSTGWPEADFYLLLTQESDFAGYWDASGASGDYLVEVTAEDAAGNLRYSYTTVTFP